MLRNESILAIDYRIDGETLYRYQGSVVERIVPWGPEAAAWRSAADAWQHFIPGNRHFRRRGKTLGTQARRAGRAGGGARRRAVSCSTAGRKRRAMACANFRRRTGNCCNS